MPLFLIDVRSRPWKFLTFSVSPRETVTRTSDAFEHGFVTNFTYPANTIAGPIQVTGIKNEIQYSPIFSTTGLSGPHPNEIEINVPENFFDSYHVTVYGSEQGESYQTSYYFAKDIPSTMPILDAGWISYTIKKKQNELVTAGTCDYSVTYSENLDTNAPRHSWTVYSSMSAQTYTIPLLPRELKEVHYELSEWDEIELQYAALREDTRFEGYENFLKPENWNNPNSFQIFSKYYSD